MKNKQIIISEKKMQKISRSFKFSDIQSQLFLRIYFEFESQHFSEFVEPNYLLITHALALSIMYHFAMIFHSKNYRVISVISS